MAKDRKGLAGDPPIDPPVGSHSEPREIHTWLDELEVLRAEYAADTSVVERIDAEIARAIGWLRGRPDLSGEAG